MKQKYVKTIMFMEKYNQNRVLLIWQIFAFAFSALITKQKNPYSACIRSKVYVSKFPYSGEEHY